MGKFEDYGLAGPKSTSNLKKVPWSVVEYFKKNPRNNAVEIDGWIYSTLTKTDEKTNFETYPSYAISLGNQDKQIMKRIQPYFGRLEQMVGKKVHMKEINPKEFEVQDEKSGQIFYRIPNTNCEITLLDRYGNNEKTKNQILIETIQRINSPTTPINPRGTRLALITYTGIKKETAIQRICNQFNNFGK